MGYDFELILAATEMTEDMADRLYGAGCDDGLVASRGGVVFVDFIREGDSLKAAVASAIADVRKAGEDVIRIEPEGLLTFEEAGEILATADGRPGA